MMERKSGFDPADNICWQFGNPGDRDMRCRCPAHVNGYRKRHLATFGRCRSGKRWFWVASLYLDEAGRKATGLADTEAEALDAAMAAVRGFRDGLPILARVYHSYASDELKKFSEAKRRARPPSGITDTRVIEYLYSSDLDDHDYGGPSYSVHYRFRITKRTTKRIFYARNGERVDEHGEPVGYGDISNGGYIAFVDRAKLEADGNIWTGHKWSRDWKLFSSLEGARADIRGNDQRLTKIQLMALKQAMAEAHPDRGGSAEAFIKARAEYVAARRAQRAGEGAPR